MNAAELSFLEVQDDDTNLLLDETSAQNIPEVPAGDGIDGVAVSGQFEGDAIVVEVEQPLDQVFDPSEFEFLPIADIDSEIGYSVFDDFVLTQETEWVDPIEGDYPQVDGDAAESSEFPGGDLVDEATPPDEIFGEPVGYEYLLFANGMAESGVSPGGFAFEETPSTDDATSEPVKFELVLMPEVDGQVEILDTIEVPSDKGEWGDPIEFELPQLPHGEYVGKGEIWELSPSDDEVVNYFLGSDLELEPIPESHTELSNDYESIDPMIFASLPPPSLEIPNLAPEHQPQSLDAIALESEAVPSIDPSGLMGVEVDEVSNGSDSENDLELSSDHLVPVEELPPMTDAQTDLAASSSGWSGLLNMDAGCLEFILGEDKGWDE